MSTYGYALMVGSSSKLTRILLGSSFNIKNKLLNLCVLGTAKDDVDLQNL
jgi:hypothetical protein